MRVLITMMRCCFAPHTWEYNFRGDMRRCAKCGGVENWVDDPSGWSDGWARISKTEWRNDR